LERKTRKTRKTRIKRDERGATEVENINLMRFAVFD
jgi:hypothetical protein